jgi:ABC-type dipeptide/oligopeptide/nickel transport system permease subunit
MSDLGQGIKETIETGITIMFLAGFTIMLVLSIISYILGRFDGYRSGQIDAQNNIVVYCLERQQNGTTA